MERKVNFKNLIFRILTILSAILTFCLMFSKWIRVMDDESIYAILKTNSGRFSLFELLRLLEKVIQSAENRMLSSAVNIVFLLVVFAVIFLVLTVFEELFSTSGAYISAIIGGVLSLIVSGCYVIGFNVILSFVSNKTNGLTDGFVFIEPYPYFIIASAFFMIVFSIIAKILDKKGDDSCEKQY